MFSSNTDICHLPKETGPCRDQSYQRWYYEESKKTCVPFLYSGCGGNFNRFKNFDTCIKFCAYRFKELDLPQPTPDRKSLPILTNIKTLKSLTTSRN